MGLAVAVSANAAPSKDWKNIVAVSGISVMQRCLQGAEVIEPAIAIVNVNEVSCRMSFLPLLACFPAAH